MAEVNEIENLCFEFPWRDDDFIRALRQRNCIGMVAEHDEKVLAFMVYELFPERLWLLNFAVHPSCQRRGIGAAMVQKMIGKLSNRRRGLRCDVRESNLAALLFFKSQGFEATALMRDFYVDMPEDAIRMEYALGKHAGAIA